MAKRTAAVHDDNEDASPEGAERGGAEDGSRAVGKKVSKAEAIRRAVDAGKKLPEEGTDFIRKQFGLEVSRQHFSATKSQMKSKGGGPRFTIKGRPGRKPKAVFGQDVRGYVAPPPRPGSVGGEADLLAAIEAMKPLVETLGADKVKRIADLLG